MQHILKGCLFCQLCFTLQEALATRHSASACLRNHNASLYNSTAVVTVAASICEPGMSAELDSQSLPLLTVSFTSYQTIFDFTA